MLEGPADSEKAFSMANFCTSLKTSGVAPFALSAVIELLSVLAVARSVRSTSLNKKLPCSERIDPSVICPATSLAMIVGTSLVPVSVRRIVLLILKPSLSVKVI